MAKLTLKALGLALLALGCSGAPDRTFATVGCGDGVDCGVVRQAVYEWNRAGDGAIDLRVRDGLDDVDVAVVLADDIDGHCARTFWTDGKPPSGDRSAAWRGKIRLLAVSPGECEGPLTIIAHELGHYMGGRDDHLADDHALMFATARDYPVSATAADVDYALR